MSAEKTALVLMMYPLSQTYRATVQEAMGRSCRFQLVAELRAHGTRGLLQHLLSSPERDVVIPLEVEEGRVVVPVLQVLAAAHRLPRVHLCDPSGQVRRIRLPETIVAAVRLFVASIDGLRARRRAARRARRLVADSQHRATTNSTPHRVLYLKNNIWYGLRAGGSVGHVAGVVNGFVELGHEVMFLSPEDPRYLDDGVHAAQVPPPKQFGLPAEANLFRMHDVAVRAGLKFAAEFRPTIIYQRLSLGDFSGVELARRLGIPLIVEYNGSEVWVSKNWGSDLRYTDSHQAAEDAMLADADLVFTISDPLHDELVDRGVPDRRVASYPNCVDPRIYDPDRWSDDEIVQTRSGLGADESSCVIMFVGTFGRWHGAEVFAAAAAAIAGDSTWCDRYQPRFVFIGDGGTRAECEQIIDGSAAAPRTVFTGLLPQHETPRYLASADAFVAPHVPNDDGSRFFGSPTKLFEYMAMGRPIIASKLDQIGEILDDGQTATMVEPGSSEDLARGIRQTVENGEAASEMAGSARALVLEQYTWKTHVEKILEGLDAATAGEPATASKPPAGFSIPENVYGSRSRLEWIMEQVRGMEAPRMAEFGCGTGLMLTAQLQRRGLDCTGWDIHEPSVAYGKAKCGAMGVDPSCLRCGDFFSLPDASYDVIIASEVLEHITDEHWDDIVKGLISKLSPRGLLLVTVPNGRGWFEFDAGVWKTGGRLVAALRLSGVTNLICKTVHGVKQSLFGRGITPGFASTMADDVSPHVQFFTRRGIERRLLGHDLEIVSREGSVLVAGPMVDLWLTGVKPAMWLNRRLGRSAGPLSAGFRLAVRPGGSTRNSSRPSA